MDVCCMDVSEIDKHVEELRQKYSQLQELKKGITELEQQFIRASKKTKLLSDLAEVTGEKYDLSITEQEQLDEVRQQKDSLETSLNMLRQKIADGLAALTVPIDREKISTSAQDTIIPYKIPNHASTIQYLKETLEFHDQVEVEGVIFESDHITVKDCHEEDKALQSFIQAVKILRFFGSQLQGKIPPEIEDSCNKLHGSKHAEIWEKLAQLGMSNPATIANQLNLGVKLVNDTLYNWTREGRFATPPIARDNEGNYFLTTTGRLVWQRYKQKFLSEAPSSIETSEQQPRDEKPQTKKPSEFTLNQFLEEVYLHKEEG